MNNETFSHSALRSKYTIQKQLGHGSQGLMYYAVSASGEPCAIKAFNLKTIPNWKANELMMREIDTLRTLDVERVPKCLDVIDASSDPEPYIFVVQQFVDGHSLLDMINNGHRFTIAEILNIMNGISKILLDISQEYHIIHRDIKPSNIMIDSSGAAWLVDFGSVVKTVKHEGGSTIAGTAGYMAPEQALGDAVAVSDIYALGMTVIHIITGCEPYVFEQKNLRPLYKKHIPNNVPYWLVNLLDRMIEPFALRRATIKEVYNLTANGNPNDVPYIYKETKETDAGDIVKPSTSILSQVPIWLRPAPELVFIITSQISIILLFFATFPLDRAVRYITVYVMLVLCILFARMPRELGLLKLLLKKHEGWDD